MPSPRGRHDCGKRWSRFAGGGCRWRLTAEEIRAEADEFASEAARETMAQVAMSYDRMAEDLEKRLANPRYRDGLFVASARRGSGELMPVGRITRP
ncbi:MAG TPA: hypothetical protein VMS01_04975 [Stellaceae bacterium]|nr:hypothetical protein [Stellaceae bacterium]